MSNERVVAFRVHLVGLPARHFGACRDVEVGIQRGKEVLPGAPQPDGSACFDGELRVKSQVKSAAPVFLGSYTFGPPAGRFLYLSWSGVQGGKREMFRRMKIPLGSITWAQLDAVDPGGGKVLEATVAGTGRGGGPACATVPCWAVGGRSGLRMLLPEKR